MIRPMSRFTAIRLLLLWVLSLGVALASLRFLLLPPEIGLAHMAHQLALWPGAFLIHAFAAPVALALLPFQLRSGPRRNRPGLHRWLGRAYGLAILAGGLSGLLIATNATGGAVAKTGFLLLALLWLATTAMGVREARAGRIAAHRRWMLRSAALTLAAVTLRLWLPLLDVTIGFDAGYPLVAWLCWVPNLIAAEWLIRRRPDAGWRQVKGPQPA